MRSSFATTPVEALREADILAAYEPSFESARARFERLCGQLEVERREHPIGAGADRLVLAHLGETDCPRKLVVLSGVHGIEGLAGSAAQIAFLERHRGARPPVHVLLVHIVNPDGMRHFRRTAPGNVDLNRNLVPDHGARAHVDDASRAVAALLSSAALARLPDPLWLACAAVRLARLGGMPKLREVFAAGQHFDPASLFYGGQAPAAEAEALIAVLREALAGSDPGQIVFFDLHSGIGAFGRPSLLANGGDAVAASRLFDANVRQGHEGEDAVYPVTGDLVQGVKAALALNDACAVTFECGTGPAVTTLLRLRYENNARHHFPGSVRRRHRARERMLRAFCPRSSRWRATYVRAANRFLDRAVIHLSGAGHGHV